MEWQLKKRLLPAAPVRASQHAKPRQPRKRKAVVITDTDEEWQVCTNPVPIKLTCSPPSDVASRGTSATPFVAPSPRYQPPSDPLSKYQPLSVRKMNSDEDWMMEKTMSAEA